MLTALVLLYETAPISLGEKKIDLYDLLTTLRVEESTGTIVKSSSRIYAQKIAHNLAYAIVSSINLPQHLIHHLNKETDHALDFLKVCALHQRQISDLVLRESYVKDSLVIYS